MEYDEELDLEIDKDMGWASGIKRKQVQEKAADPFALPRAVLKLFRLPAPIVRPLKAVTLGFFRVTFFPIISPLSYSKRFNVHGDMMIIKRPLHWRLLDGVLTRLLLTPVLLAVFLIAVVYANTHPQHMLATSTPESKGIYFKRVRLVTIDGQGLGAWYLPPITASDVAFDPEGSLLQRWPGVVLCHGLGATHEQYLTMACELHKSGFAVLMVDTRGQGESDSGAVTYGVREQLDALAGVKYLRELPNINGSKVAVIGHDIGAMAALQAAALDSSIAAVVADGMWPKFEERAQQIFSRPGGRDLPTGWLAPLYTVAFELTIRERMNRLDPQAVVRTIHTQPVLFVARHGDEYTPLEQVRMLASHAGARHETLVAGDNEMEVATRVRDFLMKSTGWQGPHAKSLGELQRLLDSRVK